MAQGSKLSKAGFLAELRGSSAQLAPGARASNPGSGVGGGRLAVPIGGFAAAADDVAVAVAAAAQDNTAPAWDVLRPDFTGLASGGKMKDWDRQEDSDDGARPETFKDAAGDSDDAAGAW